MKFFSHETYTRNHTNINIRNIYTYWSVIRKYIICIINCIYFEHVFMGNTSHKFTLLSISSSFMGSE